MSASRQWYRVLWKKIQVCTVQHFFLQCRDKGRYYARAINPYYRECGEKGLLAPHGSTSIQSDLEEVCRALSANDPNEGAHSRKQFYQCKNRVDSGTFVRCVQVLMIGLLASRLPTKGAASATELMRNMF